MLSNHLPTIAFLSLASIAEEQFFELGNRVQEKAS